MNRSPVGLIASAYAHTHVRVLQFVDKLSDPELAWHSSSAPHSIAFHLWHLARWADHLQAAIPGMTPELSRRMSSGVQIWEAEGMATRWGFDTARLGYAETGMLMDDDVAGRLPLPARDTLLDYARRTFAAAEQAVNAVDEKQFLEDEQLQPMTQGVWEAGAPVGDAILTHIIHDNRHLGQMECLYGQQGHRGSATV